MGSAPTSDQTDVVARIFRDVIHESPLSRCGMGSDTCDDWPLAYELAERFARVLDAHRAASDEKLRCSNCGYTGEDFGEGPGGNTVGCGRCGHVAPREKDAG